MHRAAIVTGCLGAIGGATSRVLAEEGYIVIGIDRAEDRRNHIGPYLRCDLSDVDMIRSTLRELEGLSGGVELLVNKAGLYVSKGFFDLTLDDFDRVMTVNVRAIFLLSQTVAKWMLAAGCGGSIVNIASTAGKLGSPIV